MSARLSACVMASGDVEALERCLESLSFADEIVVLADSRHGDGAARVARRYAQRVEEHPYLGNSDQRQRSIALAKNDWVLAIDADEVVTPGLALAIEAEMKRASKGASDGFLVDRMTFHLGRWIRHGDFYPDWTLRLFRRSRARLEGMDPHKRVVVPGPVGRIEGVLEHYSYQDLADQIDRILAFSAESASALHQADERATFTRLVIHPPARFLRAYLLKRGFMDGWPGFMIAAATAFHVFLKYARLWELREGKTSGGQRSR